MLAQLPNDNMKLGDNFTGSYCFWESRYTFRQNTAKNTDYIKKCFKHKLFRIKFPTKKSMEAYLYLFQEWSQEIPKIVIFEV